MTTPNQEDYIRAQELCEYMPVNLSEVVLDFAHIMGKLYNQSLGIEWRNKLTCSPSQNLGSEWRNKHPLSIVYSWACMAISIDCPRRCRMKEWLDAYQWIKEQATKETPDIFEGYNWRSKSMKDVNAIAEVR